MDAMRVSLLSRDTSSFLPAPWFTRSDGSWLAVCVGVMCVASSVSVCVASGDCTRVWDDVLVVG